jgi:hypothetical protein
MGQEIVADEKAQEYEVIQDHFDVKREGQCSWLTEGRSKFIEEVLAKTIDAKVVKPFFIFAIMLGSTFALAFFWRTCAISQDNHTGLVKR